MMRGLVLGIALACAPAAFADSITVGIKSEPVMDPHYLWSDPNVAYYRHIYGALTSTDKDSQVAPDLAISWEPTSPTEWTFRLRKDAKFSDGSPVTAADVVASYRRMMSIKAATPFTGALSGLRDVAAPDDFTVVLTFAKPYPVAPARASVIQIIPARLASATSDAFTSGQAAVGFGPYKVVSFRPGQSLVLERNTNYYGTPAKWDRVTFRFLPDPAARVAALLGGDVEFIDAVPPTLVERVRKEPKAHVITGPSSRAIFLQIDSARDTSPFVRDASGAPLSPNPLKDQRVREALSIAIDRKAIADRVADGLVVPTGQITPPGFGGYDKSITVPATDAARARQLLAQAGLPKGFALTIHCTNDRYVEDARICQAIGQMWSRIGLNVSVETMPYGVLTPRAMEKGGQRFSAAMLGWTDTTGEAGVLEYCVHTPVGNSGSWNWGHYSNPAIDRILDAASGTLDRAARHGELRKAMKAAMDDVAVIPLHYQSVIVAARRGLTYETWLNEFTMVDSIAKSAN
jgi:peptide/nickel transport system substrate-binding protein